MYDHHRPRDELADEGPLDHHLDDGPTPGEIQEAMDDLLALGGTDHPDLHTIEVLQASVGLPVTVSSRDPNKLSKRVTEATIKRGRTGVGNGHLPSSDHLSSYEVEYPKRCESDDCHGETAVYGYSTFGNIAGSAVEYCKLCKHEYSRDEWS